LTTPFSTRSTTSSSSSPVPSSSPFITSSHTVSSTTASSAGSTSSSDSDTPPSLGNPGLSTSAVAGIGAACGVMVLGIIAAALCFYFVRRRRKNKESKERAVTEPYPIGHIGNHAYQGPYEPAQEMDCPMTERSEVRELPANSPQFR
jgi:beta-lactamase regulating signal transducer with metallopeptidase domain